MDRHTLDLASSLLQPQEQTRLQALLVRVESGKRLQAYPSLSELPDITGPSYWPIVALYVLHVKSPAKFSVCDLYQCFWKCWQCLPEVTKAGRGPEAAHKLIDSLRSLCNSSYSSLTDLLHHESTVPAIINPETNHALTHNVLASIISSFKLPLSTTLGRSKPVVAISLPNGPLLATTLLATATFFTAAPVAYGNGVGVEQFKRDVLQSNSNLVLATSADVNRLQLHDPWLADAGINVLLVELTETDNRLQFRDLEGKPTNSSTWPRPTANRAEDVGVLLFTSGTSGTKKLVPLHVESMVTGVAMVKSSWGLTPSSRCLNQMPLNHVGGIIRNLFAPVMSGGSVICCSAFDANLFWDAVEDHAPTWYYASPSMHQCILEAGADRPESIAKSQINLVCNAAGGLLPSLARQLRDTFAKHGLECTVLPSYGMTECMPISTPPLTYKLEKTGTSGVSVGPEIAILDGNDKLIKTGVVGRIAVRGAPVFAGYLKDDVLDKSCFTDDGWFDTGDMGYLDPEGFLYITGRSKEVINRGGELISPFEVEDAVLAASANPASPIHGRVSKALAFSVYHDVLQEVVGIAVAVPEGAKRPCLKTIQEATKSTLASVKIPTLIVYMDSGVPTNNNKVLRIRLAERLDLPTISDSTPQSERYYEATCPPPNTPLSQDIPCRPLQFDTKGLIPACEQVIPSGFEFHIRTDASEAHPELLLAPKEHANPQQIWTDEEKNTLRAKVAVGLDAYAAPLRIITFAFPFPRRSDGKVDESAMKPSRATQIPTVALSNSTDTTTKVTMAFAETLGIDALDLDDDSDFFDLGGDSMKAGRLLSALRKAFAIRLAIDVLFANSTIASLTKMIDAKTAKSAPKTTDAHSESSPKLLPGCSEVRSSTNPLLLGLQLLPMTILYPMRRAMTWTFFIYCLTFTQDLITSDSIPGRFLNLVISLAIAKVITEIIAPILAIIFKWMLIGRYRQGLYPMWGSYHTRWWLCEKVLVIGGLGIYEHFAITRKIYYQALGAKIGRNVTIDKAAKLGECDLITIEDGVVLDKCTVRPFAVERNTSMYLGKIHIGANASVGLASIVAAGTTVPTNACIGPNSSSWETDDADEANRDLSSSKIEKPQWALNAFVALPISVFAAFIGAIPWMGGLLPLVITEPKQNQGDMLREVIIWFASPNRVAFHYVALACHASLGPFFFFFTVVAIKKLFDACCGGPIQPGPAKNRSNMEKLRMDLLRTLMPDGKFHKLTALFGTHYEATSIFARMLGAKIGKRVYWPGKGPSIQDWDMLDIGDDVVFGSRSYIVTSDGRGTKKVKIGSGSMVADRVTLVPGVELGERTIMGSGALTQRNKLYPSDTTWVGSKQNDAVCLKTGLPTLEPPVLGHRLRQWRDTIDAQVSLYRYWNDSTVSFATRNPFDSKRSSTCDLESYGDEEWLDAKQLDNGYTPRPSITVLPASRASEDSFGIHNDKENPSSSPFGRAFYQGMASYRVWGQFTISCYSTFITVLTGVFWNIHSIVAIQVVAGIMKQSSYQQYFLGVTSWRPFALFGFFAGLVAAIMAIQILLVLSTLIAAKWILMGRRKQGNYDWDKTPYCQRWQLFLKIESLRQNCYGGQGILGMLTGTHWISLYFRALGAQIGRDCALFASGTPSLYFTEPDLLTLGDRVCVDDASLVCHINTRGKFDLNRLSVGDRSVLRSGSRLLSGAKMEADSCLLEHTLVMAGDVVDDSTTRQGWPSEEHQGSRMPTMRVGFHWENA